MSNVSYPHTFKANTTLKYVNGKAYAGMRIRILEDVVVTSDETQLRKFEVEVLQCPSTTAYKHTERFLDVYQLMASRYNIWKNWAVETPTEFTCLKYDFANCTAEVVTECDDFVNIMEKTYGVTDTYDFDDTEGILYRNNAQYLRKCYKFEKDKYYDVVYEQGYLRTLITEIMGILLRDYGIIDAWTVVAHAMLIGKRTNIVSRAYLKHVYNIINLRDYEYYQGTSQAMKSYVIHTVGYTVETPRLTRPVTELEDWMRVFDKKIFYFTKTMSLKKFNKILEEFSYHGPNMDSEYYDELLWAQEKYHRVTNVRLSIRGYRLLDTLVTASVDITPSLLSSMIGQIQCEDDFLVFDKDLKPYALTDSSEDESPVDQNILEDFVEKLLVEGIWISPGPISITGTENLNTKWYLTRIDGVWKATVDGIPVAPKGKVLGRYEVDSEVTEPLDEVKYSVQYDFDYPEVDYMRKIRKILNKLDVFCYSRVRAMLRHYIVWNGFDIKIPRYTVDREAFMVFQRIYQLLGNILTFNGWHVRTNNPTAWREVVGLFENMKPGFNETWDIKDVKAPYTLKPYQKDLVKQLYLDDNQMKFVWLETGQGKTKIALNYFRKLNNSEIMPEYIIWISAPESLSNILGQCEIEGFRVAIVSDPESIKPGRINLIADSIIIKFDLDLMVQKLVVSIVVLDECQNSFSESQRGVQNYNITKMAGESILMTGTLYRGKDGRKFFGRLIDLNYEFEITENNYLVTLVDVLSKKVKHDIISIYEDTYDATISAIVGALNKTVELVKRGIAVFLMIPADRYKVDVEATLTINKIEFEWFDKSKNYSPWDCPSERGPEYHAEGIPQVMCTTKKNCSGYNMNRYAHMVICTKSTNQAERSQAEGRIRRIDNTANPVYYYYFYAKASDRAKYIADRKVSAIVDSARKD